jgi:hypothetical protein
VLQNVEDSDSLYNLNASQNSKLKSTTHSSLDYSHTRHYLNSLISLMWHLFDFDLLEGVTLNVEVVALAFMSWRVLL